MKIAKSLKLALNILLHSRLRSWLSIIGIVIGVVAIVSILSLGEGLQKNLETRLGGLGADIITISSGVSKATGVEGFFKTQDINKDSAVKPKGLKNRDVQTLKLIDNLDNVGCVVLKQGEIEYLSETSSVFVKGVDARVWKDMVVTGLESGRFLVEGDRNFIVVGNKVAKDMFKQDIQLNRQIVIEEKPFRVVGMLKESGLDDDKTVFMLIDSVRMIFEDIDAKEFNLIEIKIKDINLLDNTINEITEKLMLTRAVNEKTKDFTINSVKATQEMVSDILRILTLFLGAIAMISLIVGAVGIANTMFTTVLEKTKDIGIMKSIGAKNRDILLIVLFNSAMIGLAGGIIGSIFGILVSKIIPYLLSGIIPNIEFTTVVSFEIIMFVLVFSILIGVIAGIVPAYRASKMNPVDAIRY